MNVGSEGIPVEYVASGATEASVQMEDHPTPDLETRYETVQQSVATQDWTCAGCRCTIPEGERRVTYYDKVWDDGVTVWHKICFAKRHF